MSYFLWDPPAAMEEERDPMSVKKNIFGDKQKMTVGGKGEVATSKYRVTKFEKQFLILNYHSRKFFILLLRNQS